MSKFQYPITNQALNPNYQLVIFGLFKMISFQSIIDFFLKLEGPYKWYAIAVVLVVLTAIITRFIFNTLKWFLLIAFAAIIIITLIQYLTPFNILSWLVNLG